MRNNFKADKAYKNLEFLNSADARTIRMLSEFYEPRSRFRKLNIVDTIVFFGSARLISKRDAQKNLTSVKKKKNINNKKLKEAEQLLFMSKYYENAVALSKRLTEWSLSLPRPSLPCSHLPLAPHSCHMSFPENPLSSEVICRWLQGLLLF